MKTASFSTKAFFSAQQLRDIALAMQHMNGIGIIVDSFFKLERTKSDGGRVKTDEQYRSFMGLARLWRVVETIISIAFIDKLVDHRLTLKDRYLNEYCLVLCKTKKAVEPWFPPDDLVEIDDEGVRGEEP